MKKDFFKSKMFVWIIMWVTFVVFLSVGIALTVVGAPDYYNIWLPSAIKSLTNGTPITIDLSVITLFVYGLFFVVLSILNLVTILLYSYGIFSKKAKQ